MPIRVACQCGKRLAVKDEFAGKTVKCPQCGQPLQIPQPAAQPGGSKSSDGVSDLLAEAGLKEGMLRCPGCRAPLPDEAILCVHCGYDLRKGHRIKTRIGAESEIDEEEFADLPVHGVRQLDEAERELARNKAQQKHLSKGVPWWVLFLALVGLVGFAIAMVQMPQDRVMVNSGVILMVVGGLGAFFFVVRLLIIAFQESFLQGVLTFFVPLYILYYVGTRWDKCAGLFIAYLVCAGVQGLGYALFRVAPMLQGQGA